MFKYSFEYFRYSLPHQMSKHEHLFIFKESCKKKSEEVCVVIWTNFDSFANTYLTWVVYFHFQVSFSNRVCAWFFANSQGLGTSSQVIVFLEFFYNFLCDMTESNRTSFPPRLFKKYFLFYAWAFDVARKRKYLKFENLISLKKF